MIKRKKKNRTVRIAETKRQRDKKTENATITAQSRQESKSYIVVVGIDVCGVSKIKYVSVL